MTSTSLVLPGHGQNKARLAALLVNLPTQPLFPQTDQEASLYSIHFYEHSGLPDFHQHSRASLSFTSKFSHTPPENQFHGPMYHMVRVSTSHNPTSDCSQLSGNYFFSSQWEHSDRRNWKRNDLFWLMVSGNFSPSMRGKAKLAQSMLVKEGVAPHILITDWEAKH